jgi:arylsulfatase
MEIYAAMVELMDQQLGRVIARLEADGELENTYFVFFSDNGASAIAPLMYPDSSEEWLNATWDRNMENAGKRQNFTVQGREWASASNAPLRLSKGSVAEGGIRSPLIVAGPSIPNGHVSDALAHVMDIAPTIYELAGVDPLTDAAFKGTLEMQGTSLLPVWRSDSDSVRDGFMTELFNARAGRDGKWKIANMPRPLGTGQWELYDLSVDPGEANNLAAEHPEILETMVAQYEAFAVENGVIPPFPPPTQTPRRMYPYVCDDACEAAFARFMEMQPRPGAQPPQDQN